MELDELLTQNAALAKQYDELYDAVRDNNTAIAELTQHRVDEIFNAPGEMTFDKVNEAFRFVNTITLKRSISSMGNRRGFISAKYPDLHSISETVKTAVGRIDPALTTFGQQIVLDETSYIQPVVMMSSKASWDAEEKLGPEESFEFADYDIFEYGQLDGNDFHHTIEVLKPYIAKLVEAGAENVTLGFEDPWESGTDYYFYHRATLDVASGQWVIVSTNTVAENLSTLEQVFDTVGYSLLRTRKIYNHNN